MSSIDITPSFDPSGFDAGGLFSDTTSPGNLDPSYSDQFSGFVAGSSTQLDYTNGITDASISGDVLSPNDALNLSGNSESGLGGNSPTMLLASDNSHDTFANVISGFAKFGSGLGSLFGGGNVSYSPYRGVTSNAPVPTRTPTSVNSTETTLITLLAIGVLLFLILSSNK